MPLTFRIPVAAAAATLALAAAGCGGGTPASSDPERNAFESLEVFLEVCEDGNGIAAEHLLTEATRMRFLEAGSPKEGCAKILRLIEDTEPPASETPLAILGVEFAELRVTDVRAEGGIAHAKIDGAGQSVEVELENVGNQWKIANPPLFPPEEAEGLEERR